MKRIILLLMVLLPFCTLNAQFVNMGILGGVGFGGPHGSGFKINSGINPEFGFIFKYNLTEKISIRTFITFDIHKFTLTGGRQVDIDNTNTIFTPKDASNYSFSNSGVTQHVDLTYIVVEDKFDISGGLFWSGRFTKMVVDDDPRIFYGATDSQILSQPNAPDVFKTEFGNDHPTDLYASDQIQKGMHGITGGVYVAASGGTKAFKVMLRYDLGMKNYYSQFSTSNKLHEGFVRLGVIYYFNS